MRQFSAPKQDIGSQEKEDKFYSIIHHWNLSNTVEPTYNELWVKSDNVWPTATHVLLSYRCCRYSRGPSPREHDTMRHCHAKLHRVDGYYAIIKESRFVHDGVLPLSNFLLFQLN